MGNLSTRCIELEAADVVVALDSDFIASGPASTRYAHDFALRRRRRRRLDMNRLYAVESALSSTGGKADHRFPLRHDEIAQFTRDLSAGISASASSVAGGKPYARFLEGLAGDLLSRRGASVVIPGEYQTPEVHALAHRMNAALGNIGKTVFYADSLEFSAVDQIESLRQLDADMAAGRVETLLIFGGNPVYDAPVDFEFARNLSKVRTAVHIAPKHDETSQLCAWHVPESHTLRDWGDTRGYDGTVTIQQPLIAPLYDSRSPLQVLDAIEQPRANSLGGGQAYLDGSERRSGFRRLVEQGRTRRHGGHGPAGDSPRAESGSVGAPPPTPLSGMEIVLRPDVYIVRRPLRQ